MITARPRRRSASLTGFLCAATFASLAAAQQPPPFFGGGAVAFDPEIGVVNSGALVDAQVVVSHDRRYVTINMRASLTRLQSLTAFEVARAQQLNAGGGGGGASATGGAVSQGFVGGAGFIDDDELIDQGPGAQRTQAGMAPTGVSHVNTSPGAILNTTAPAAADSLLRRQGMFRLHDAVAVGQTSAR